jgi:hypothetical protein
MIVFHLSPTINRESILKHGLIPKSKVGRTISYEPRIFVSSSKKYGFAIDWVGYEFVDAWKFDIEEDLLQPDEFSGHKNHYFINEGISPDRLSLHESF